eukprot:350209-Chlamydomonas_euryale.AAC.1
MQLLPDGAGLLPCRAPAYSTSSFPPACDHRGRQGEGRQGRGGEQRLRGYLTCVIVSKLCANAVLVSPFIAHDRKLGREGPSTTHVTIHTTVHTIMHNTARNNCCKCWYGFSGMQPHRSGMQVAGATVGHENDDLEPCAPKQQDIQQLGYHKHVPQGYPTPERAATQ